MCRLYAACYSLLRSHALLVGLACPRGGQAGTQATPYAANEHRQDPCRAGREQGRIRHMAGAADISHARLAPAGQGSTAGTWAHTTGEQRQTALTNKGGWAGPRTRCGSADSAACYCFGSSSNKDNSGSKGQGRSLVLRVSLLSPSGDPAARSAGANIEAETLENQLGALGHACLPAPPASWSLQQMGIHF